MRSGPWKLFVKNYRFDDESVSAGTLYNLREDIGEATDVSTRNPDVVTRLKALAEASKKDIGDGEGNPGKNVRKAAYIDMKDAVTLTKRP